MTLTDFLLCLVSAKKSDKQFESMSWSEFVKSKKAELINYLKSKQLYVNEVTAT